MTINAQSGKGKIRLFNDFFGAASSILTLTSVTEPAGDFYIGGCGIDGTDGGSAYLGSDSLNGVVRLTSSATDQDFCFIGTDVSFDVALMAPIVIEARVSLPATSARAIFIGLTSILTYNEPIGDIIDKSSATVGTYTAELAGFWQSSELTDSTDWIMVYNGGAATAQTTVANIDAGVTITAGAFQVLRLEVDNNGTARWYIDGVLKQTVAGAVSTTTDFAVCCGVGSNTTTAGTLDVDYLLVEANRDWNA